MKTKTQLSDFTFKFTGHGHYKVIYVSPTTQKSWMCTTSNMSLIDITKNADYPTQSNLNQLKRLCKTS